MSKRVQVINFSGEILQSFLLRPQLVLDLAIIANVALFENPVEVMDHTGMTEEELRRIHTKLSELFLGEGLSFGLLPEEESHNKEE